MSLLSPTAGLRRRSIFYGQMATLLRAGIPLSRILHQLVTTPLDPTLRQVTRRLQSELDHGATWIEAFTAVPRWAPPFDLALIEAGERAGRLDDAFDTLARHHRARADNLRRILSSSAYPLLVFHLAAFIIPIPALVGGGSFAAYLFQSFGTLGAVYGLVGGILWAGSGQRGEAWRSMVERLTVRIPVVGPARSALALSRLARALEALLSAGVVVTEAWPIAARASGSPILIRTVADWPDRLATGQTPGELVAISGPFPETFVSSYATGEISGKLDEQLRWLAQHYEAEGFQKLEVLAVVVPMIGYLAVALWIVLYIFSMFSGYMNILNSLLG